MSGQSLKLDASLETLFFTRETIQANGEDQELWLARLVDRFL